MWRSLLVLGFFGIVLAGCGSPRPKLGTDNLQCGLKENKFYVDDVFEQNHVYLKTLGRKSGGTATNILELSAGGEYGAYGAGFLEGWGKVGAAGRPVPRDDVRIVTGVSTGSMMATYAFLGHRDAELRKLYDNLKDEMIYKKNNWIKLLWANSLYGTEGKRALLKKYLTSEIIDQVAAAPAGRFLYIGMVNLDTGEFKRVDMVALARGIHDKALRDDCYRAVIDASSAIEIAFEPVFIDNSMFGDGGARSHLFLVSPETIAVGMKDNDLSGSTYRSFALIHDDLEVEQQRTDNGVLPIAERTASISTDQTLKDSVRLTHALVTDPATIVGADAAKKMPTFIQYYAAAATRACECKDKWAKTCEKSSKSGVADTFCQPYMQCLSAGGEQDGQEYATTGNWLPFEKLNLGSGPACNVQQGHPYRVRPAFR